MTAADSMTAADLRKKLTLARQDITNAELDDSLPTSEKLRLRWEAYKLSGLHELAEKAERGQRAGVV